MANAIEVVAARAAVELEECWGEVLARLGEDEALAALRSALLVSVAG
jgi:hypothetical protein